MAVPMSCFFDDFVIASTPSLADNAQKSLEVMFDLLGWAYDKTGDKSDCFSSSVAALGVVFGLDESSSGLVKVSNTAKRISEVEEFLAVVLSDGKLGHKKALSLRGRLAFCEAQVFGRTGQLALQAISQHAYRKPFVAWLDPYLKEALLALRSRISSGPPRSMSSAILECMYIFTDAAFHEDLSGGLGGVICAATGEVVSWFGVQLPSAFVSEIMKRD